MTDGGTSIFHRSNGAKVSTGRRDQSGNEHWCPRLTTSPMDSCQNQTGAAALHVNSCWKRSGCSPDQHESTEDAWQQEARTHWCNGNVCRNCDLFNLTLHSQQSPCGYQSHCISTRILLSTSSRFWKYSAQVFLNFDINGTDLRLDQSLVCLNQEEESRSIQVGCSDQPYCSAHSKDDWASDSELCSGSGHSNVSPRSRTAASFCSIVSVIFRLKKARTSL